MEQTILVKSSILAEHLDAVTSIENFDPMSKPNIDSN